MIGEKIKKYSSGDMRKIKFDDQFYADWIIKSGDNLQSFYLGESIQKLIDF